MYIHVDEYNESLRFTPRRESASSIKDIHAFAIKHIDKLSETERKELKKLKTEHTLLNPFNELVYRVMSVISRRFPSIQVSKSDRQLIKEIESTIANKEVEIEFKIAYENLKTKLEETLKKDDLSAHLTACLINTEPDPSQKFKEIISQPDGIQSLTTILKLVENQKSDSQLKKTLIEKDPGKFIKQIKEEFPSILQARFNYLVNNIKKDTLSIQLLENIVTEFEIKKTDPSEVKKAKRSLKMEVTDRMSPLFTELFEPPPPSKQTEDSNSRFISIYTGLQTDLDIKKSYTPSFFTEEENRDPPAYLNHFRTKEALASIQPKKTDSIKKQIAKTILLQENRLETIPTDLIKPDEINKLMACLNSIENQKTSSLSQKDKEFIKQIQIDSPLILNDYFNQLIDPENPQDDNNRFVQWQEPINKDDKDALFIAFAKTKMKLDISNIRIRKELLKSLQNDWLDSLKENHPLRQRAKNILQKKTPKNTPALLKNSLDRKVNELIEKYFTSMNLFIDSYNQLKNKINKKQRNEDEINTHIKEILSQVEIASEDTNISPSHEKFTSNIIKKYLQMSLKSQINELKEIQATQEAAFKAIQLIDAFFADNKDDTTRVFVKKCLFNPSFPENEEQNMITQENLAQLNSLKTSTICTPDESDDLTTKKAKTYLSTQIESKIKWLTKAISKKSRPPRRVTFGENQYRIYL